MIIEVDKTNLFQAAVIHSISWKESHRSFCAPDFVEMHTAERQREYISVMLLFSLNIVIADMELTHCSNYA